MKTTGNTILITGGNAGIGLSFAERFLKEGNHVIICGRDKKKLEEVAKRFPEIRTEVCDLGKEKERIGLVDRVLNEYPDVNLLINNAGVQQRFNFLKSPQPWDYYQQEITTNLEAPIHLITLLLPHLKKQTYAAIVNVSSGLAFAPMAAAPIYCATKAAMHSFTISLRYQLSDSNIEVVEIVPPMVNTNLGGAGLHLNAVSSEEFTDGVFKALNENKQEIGYGTSLQSMRLSRDESDQVTVMLNKMIPY